MPRGISTREPAHLPSFKNFRCHKVNAVVMLHPPTLHEGSPKIEYLKYTPAECAV